MTPYPSDQDLLEAHDMAVALLHELVGHEDDRCCYDHNGFCQTHYHDGIERGGCTVYRARKFLGLQ